MLKADVSGECGWNEEERRGNSGRRRGGQCTQNSIFLSFLVNFTLKKKREKNKS
jgi:hypothetical protein